MSRRKHDENGTREPVKIETSGGLYLPEIDLWLDPHGPKQRAFVSHAHADHFAPHEQIFCSPVTRTLAVERFGSEASFTELAWGEMHDELPGMDEFRIHLLPAGHIAGSAQIHIERKSDGASLLYTGDFKTRHGLASEPAQWIHADTLIMETTFGLPKFILPPTETMYADIVKFVRETLEDGEIPVVLGYSLGKAQEILMLLHEGAPELKFQAHPSVIRMNETLMSLGYELPPCSPLTPEAIDPGTVLIMPPSVARGQAMRKVKNRRTAMITGWGMDSGARYRYQVDEAFPLSDHAGYDDLLDYVSKVDPQRVLTLHGYAVEFAQDLRSRGVEAWSVFGDDQMELELSAPAEINAAKPTEMDRREGQWAAFVETCDAIAASSGKLKKQEILARYLTKLNDEDLARAATYLTGKPFARTDTLRSLNVGWALIRRVLLDISRRTDAEYSQISKSQADAGRTAHLVLEGFTEPIPEGHSLARIDRLVRDLAQARGPAPKIALLEKSLHEMRHDEAAYVVRLLTGDLRIGLKEGLLEEAIAEAFDQKSTAVREAHMLLGDIGKTAQMARADELDQASVTPFTPLKVMLASPEETAEAIWERLGNPGSVWLEDKFDGIRAQLHKQGDHVEIFSRDLRPLHKEFPELIDAALEKFATYDLILDGEIIAYAEGKKLSFFDLQKRLGRIHEGDLFFGQAVPVRFVAFDLMFENSEPLIDLPLSKRREKLQAITFSRPFERCEVFEAESADAIEIAFKRARQRENEGLIAKDPTSTYSPGRRGKSWLKLKKAMSTLDCVVVKAQQGHGKRSHVLSDYTFAVRDERTGELRVIGKAYSGLTDKEIEDLTEHFKQHTTEIKRRVHTVTPHVVLEIAFDSINPSKRHDSGLALRFPRIKAIRNDKSIDEIDTLAYAKQLAGVA